MILALQQAASPDWINLDPAAPPDILGAWLVCFLTLAVFSFLYRDNPFYKLAEHVFVGLGTAYYALQYYASGVVHNLHEHIHGAVEAAGNGSAFVLGGVDVDPWLAAGLRGTAVVLSIMLLWRLFAPNSWAPRWPLAIMVGVYAALKMTGETQSNLVLLVANSIGPLNDPTALTWAQASVQGAPIETTQFWFTFTRLVYVTGMICALAHFVFTVKRGRALGIMSRVGIITLMITFGSMFGFTVLGRIALLIERVDDLRSYAGGAYSLGGGAAAAGAPQPGAGEPITAVLLSPPILLGALMTVLLALGALKRRGDPGGGTDPASAG